MQLDPKFALAWARLSRAEGLLYFIAALAGATTCAMQRRRALENAQKLEPNSAETLLALGYYQRRVLADHGLAKTTFSRVSKMLPGNSKVPSALCIDCPVTKEIGIKALPTSRKPAPWTHLIRSYLPDTAWAYGVLRQFPMALKLYDQALDITPNDPDVMAAKANIYQAQGNLEQAARLSVTNNRADSRCPREQDQSIRLNETTVKPFDWCNPDWLDFKPKVK